MWEIPKIEITRHRLENCLRVILHRREYLTATYRILMPHGYRNETFPESVHLLEHMLFKPEDNVFPIFQRIGGEINGYVSMDEFSIYWIVPKIFQDKAINGVRKILTENYKYWTGEIFEKEKAVILKELGENFSNPARYIGIFLRKKLFGENTPGTHSPETVEKAFKNITLNDVRAELESISPTDSVLSVVGDVDIEKLEPLKDWRGRGGGWKKLRIETEPGYHFEYRDLPMSYIAIGWISASKKEDYSEILSLLSTILAAFPTSRLYRKLRLEKGLVYYVEAFNVAHIDTGLFAIMTSTTPRHLETVINTTLEEIERIIDEGPTEEEVQDMKNMFFGALYNLTDSKSGLAGVLAYDELFFGDALRLYRKVTKVVQNLKPENVQKAARRYLKPEKNVICILGKKHRR